LRQTQSDCREKGTSDDDDDDEDEDEDEDDDEDDSDNATCDSMPLHE
jgi:hypothetical protein